MSGTSMAAPTVAGAVALYKSSRPRATPSEVREALRYLGNLKWKTSTDPDSTHEPLLEVSRIGSLGTFALSPGSSTVARAEGGTTATIPITVARSATFFERVKLSVTSLPGGWTASPSPSSLMGWTANAASVSVVVPRGTSPGTYQLTVTGTNQGRSVSTNVSIIIVRDLPTAKKPTVEFIPITRMSQTEIPVRVVWPAATDPSSPIAGYEVEMSQIGGSWGSTLATSGAARQKAFTLKLSTSYRFRIRAVDAGGNWSPWVTGDATAWLTPIDDRSKSISRVGSWHGTDRASAYRSTLIGSRQKGASLSLSFTGHAVAVVAPRSLAHGKAQVYVDGRYIKTIDLRTKSSTSRVVVFTRSFPNGGRHRIRLVALGKSPAPLFRLDAFVVSK
jgi:hypothetical protein